jgi:hypothetical protein
MATIVAPFAWIVVLVGAGICFAGKRSETKKRGARALRLVGLRVCGATNTHVSASGESNGLGGGMTHLQQLEDAKPAGGGVLSQIGVDRNPNNLGWARGDGR